MVVFVVSSGTNKNFTIFAPPTKILRFTLKNYNCTPPWIKFYQVRLKVDAIGSVSSVIDCNEVFLWLTHQKLDHSKHFWCNVRNWVGQLVPLPPPPLATRLTSGEKVRISDEAEHVQSVSYSHITSLSGLYIYNAIVSNAN